MCWKRSSTRMFTSGIRSRFRDRGWSMFHRSIGGVRSRSTKPKQGPWASEGGVYVETVVDEPFLGAELEGVVALLDGDSMIQSAVVGGGRVVPDSSNGRSGSPRTPGSAAFDVSCIPRANRRTRRPLRSSSRTCGGSGSAAFTSNSVFARISLRPRPSWLRAWSRHQIRPRSSRASSRGRGS